MEVLAQAPQPTIKCYHSVINNKASKLPYLEFTPNSPYTSGRNLQSYNFERSIDNFGGSFSFTVKEDVDNLKDPFMDKVKPLDIIEISESGFDSRIDFIGVVTTISVGGMASNLNKVVTVSGKSIEWLFSYLNINADIKLTVFNNEAADRIFKADFQKENGTTGFSIKKTVEASINMFKKQVSEFKTISNYVISDLIDLWYGNDYIDAPTDSFAYPISSNLFEGERINVIDFIKKLLPSPIYEIFGYIDVSGKPKIAFRQVPYDNPKAKYTINPTHLTDYTLTRSCEEVYTAFMTYIEGTKQDPTFFMNKAVTEGTVKGYDFAKANLNKAALYGYQLLTCSFVGYNATLDAKTDETKIKQMNENLEKWFSNLDEMYTGDFTLVNYTQEKHAKIGEWINFAKGMYYIISEKHSWNYGDNPMLNYQVIRGGEYSGYGFKPITRLSAVYKEFE